MMLSEEFRQKRCGLNGGTIQVSAWGRLRKPQELSVKANIGTTKLPNMKSD
jgi:hypothetical protein